MKKFWRQKKQRTDRPRPSSRQDYADDEDNDRAILSGFNEKPSCKNSLGTKGKKAGPKSLWTTEMLNDLVDIIANDDN